MTTIRRPSQTQQHTHTHTPNCLYRNFYAVIRIFVLVACLLYAMQQCIHVVPCKTDCSSCHQFSKRSCRARLCAFFFGQYGSFIFVFFFSWLFLFYMLVSTVHGHLTVVIYHKNVERWKTSHPNQNILENEARKMKYRMERLLFGLSPFFQSFCHFSLSVCGDRVSHNKQPYL